MEAYALFMMKLAICVVLTGVAGGAIFFAIGLMFAALCSGIGFFYDE